MFDKCWLGTQATKKTQLEKQDKLMEMKLMEEDLGKKVTVKGVEVYSHVMWADKVKWAAKAFPDTNNLLVKSMCFNMPLTLRTLVPASKSMWKTFCDAVRAVNIADMKEMKEEKQCTKKLEDKIWDLKAKATTPSTPSKALAVTLRRVQVRALIPAPVFTPKPTAANPGPQTPVQIVQAPARTDTDKDNGKEANKNVVLFHHKLKLRNHTNSVWAWGHFDDGAMVDAMLTAMWERVGEHLAPLEPSCQLLQMANGSIIMPIGCWKGIVWLAGVEAIATLEVFDSAGGWDLLFGKQLLKTFRVVHDYSDNTIKVNIAGYTKSLTNSHRDMANMSPEQCTKTSGGCSASPMREVYSEIPHDPISVTDTVPSEEHPSLTYEMLSMPAEAQTELGEANVVLQGEKSNVGGNVEVEVEGLGQKDTIFT
ncbi:hypothetical protein H0H87_011128 [Tephrocybe sp. NHM501043]|nr:hypothetical protein H0H87_011128 [Tephrocybe sp. NHM501043]